MHKCTHEILIKDVLIKILDIKGITIKLKETSSQLDMAIIHQPKLANVMSNIKSPYGLLQTYVAKCMYVQIKHSLAYSIYRI